MHDRESRTAPERGAAALFIELQDGVITVRHGDDTTAVLAGARVRHGAWSAMYGEIVSVLRTYETD